MKGFSISKLGSIQEPVFRPGNLISKGILSPRKYSKLQYFGYLMQTANSLEKTLMLGNIKGKRRKGQQRMRLLDGIIDSMDINCSKLQEIVEAGEPGVLQSMGSQRVRHNLVTEQQQQIKLLASKM